MTKELQLNCEWSVESSKDALHYATQLNLDVDLWYQHDIQYDVVHEFDVTVDPKNPIMGFKTKLGISADDFFDFLTSVDGYMFLDPMSNPSHFDHPIFGPFQQHDDGKSKIQVEYAVMNKLHRDFVVLNVHDYERRRFLCGSVLHSLRPGSSGFNGDPVRASTWGRSRVTNLSAFEVLPVGDNQCVFRAYQWCALNGWFPSEISAVGNSRYMKQLLQRANERFPVEL